MIFNNRSFHFSSRLQEEFQDLTKMEENHLIIGAKNLRQKLMDHVGAKQFWAENETTLKRIDASKANSQDELEPRRMSDSITEVLLPIGDDLVEREKYLTFYRTVRLGKLLEDMDTLAGWVGFKFFKGPTPRAPFSLVTACVDEIDFHENIIQSDKNIKITGFVSWAGRTSLEITMNVDQIDESGNWHRIADSAFVMVARLLKDGSAAIVNPMVTVTEEEAMFYKRGIENQKTRKINMNESLLKTAPTAEERELMHSMFLTSLDPKKSSFHSRTKPEDHAWMEETHLKNLLICHPQSRNLYNKIFGGFLMREAFELAWANTCVFIKARPQATCIDDIVFRKPVEVGSLLYLSSQIVYTEPNYLLQRVHAQVVQPKTGQCETTNIFYIHFDCPNGCPQIMPNSYGEFMLYLDGRRHRLKQLKTPSIPHM